MGSPSTGTKKKQRKQNVAANNDENKDAMLNDETEILSETTSSKQEEVLTTNNDTNTKIWTPQSDQEALEQLLTILQYPEEILLPSLSKPSKDHDTTTIKTTNKKSKNEEKGIQVKLTTLTQYLFTRMEELAQEHEKFLHHFEDEGDKEKQQEQQSKMENEEEKEDELCPLSGMKELFIPVDEEKGEYSDAIIDMETIWGQVEIQNEALMKKINTCLKDTKKQIKKDSEVPILLDTIQMSDDDDDDDDLEENEESKDENIESENEDDGEKVEEDEETKRIRERMERAMAEMENESENDQEEQINTHESTNLEKNKNDSNESLEDPAAEELNDGFFDIQDMEAFADEEEDFHTFVNNDGYDIDDIADKDDEDVEGKTRKKYRDEEVIDALHSMYKDSANDDDGDRDDFDSDDEEDDDVINMTAADFFGKPKARYFKNWTGHKNQKKGTKKVRWNGEESKKEDDASWNDYDFDEKEKNDNNYDGWPTREDHNETNDANDAEEQNDVDDDNSESNDIDKPVTNFSKQQQKLDAQTKQLEEEILAEKPWQMKGETKSSARPVNSLLESTPEFTMASKIAPTITIEHTNNLEDMIKARILAEDWDDVIPRELPDIFKNKRSNDLEDVSQEKSKLGLGELYEREYLKKAMGYDKDKVEKETAEDKARNEMRELFANLCSKLDAMSNYHFAPRPVMEEADVREITTPAIAVEEVIPMHVSDQRGVAPEEVYDGGKRRGKNSVLKGESEMDQADRKRLRNTKKAARRKARKEKLADEKLVSRLRPAQSGLNNPYEKRKIREELSLARSRGKIITGEIDENKDFTTSTKFFKRMQEDTEREIKGTIGGSKKRKLDGNGQAQGKSSAYML